jgi:hypothetical protein
MMCPPRRVFGSLCRRIRRHVRRHICHHICRQLSRCVVITGVSLGGLIAGCANTGIDVQRVATSATAPAAYELRGPDSAQIEARAADLCPKGHVILRSWERRHHTPEHDNIVERWRLELADVFDGHAPDQAQAQIQCRP